MIRDWAGLDSDEDDSAELVSAGPGDGGSGSGSSSSSSSTEVVIGSDDSLLRAEVSTAGCRAVPLLLPPRFRVV
jgi:hypothetical protein